MLTILMTVFNCLYGSKYVFLLFKLDTNGMLFVNNQLLSSMIKSKYIINALKDEE